MATSRKDYRSDRGKPRERRDSQGSRAPRRELVIGPDMRAASPSQGVNR